MMVNKKSSIRKKSQGDYQKEYVSNAKRGLIEKLFLALAVLMLCACSSDDELESSFNGANATGGVAYLTVNLREVGSSTRATADGYAYGSEAEQTIANVYFYFYDDNGDYIAHGSTGSVDGTANSTDNSDGKQNIEWNSNTVVAVYGLQEGNLPTQMLTIINQPSSFNITNKTLAEATKTLAGTPYADASGNFVMSTSVYEAAVNNVTTILNTTALEESNFALEPVDVDGDYGTNGDATPVEVYVERLAAKVGVSLDSNIGFATGIGVSNYNLIPIGNLSDVFAEPLPQLGGTYGYYVQLQGWNVDGVARDAYMSKQIDTNWSLGSWTWNASGSYRCYWAESPNYGIEHNYPTTSYNLTTGTANTDTTEGTTPLDEYLKYVSLSDANTLAFSTGYAYCGENTNTTLVLGNASSTGLTNIIVKAQLLNWNPNYTSGTGVDIVKYGGYLYAVEDFCQECVGAVKFVDIIDDAIDALPESEYSGLDFSALKTAAANGNLFKATDSDATDLSAFGGEMLSLYNAYDGNVTIGYNMDSSTIDNNIVYSGLALDDYNFWFSVDASQLTDDVADLTNAGLLVSIDDNYYIPLTEGNTLRSYFLSALAADATATNNSFGTNYPNYYKEGLMYYSVPIEHLATAPTTGINEGQYGVVRNHWYDISVTSVSSFGRGIAKEDEVIVPIGDNGVQTNSIGTSTKVDTWKLYDQTVIF